MPAASKNIESGTGLVIHLNFRERIIKSTKSTIYSLGYYFNMSSLNRAIAVLREVAPRER